MANVSFQSSYDKIFRRTLSLGRQKGFFIESENKEEGTITLISKETFFNSQITLKIKINEIDENCVSIHISAQTKAHWFRKLDELKHKLIEERFLSSLCSRV